MSEAEPKAATAEPIMIDLGKHRRKRIKRLRQGEGRLADDVAAAIEELRQSGAIEGNAQPVIVVVREKKRRTGWGW